MTRTSGKEVVRSLAGKDLNESGAVVNLVVTGNSRFYDYSFIENELEIWTKYNEYPDLVIVGGASGVDYLAERWAENLTIPIAVFSEAWQQPRQSDGTDSGRPADNAASQPGLHANFLDERSNIPIGRRATSRPLCSVSGRQCFAPNGYGQLGR